MTRGPCEPTLDADSRMHSTFATRGSPPARVEQLDRQALGVYRHMANLSPSRATDIFRDPSALGLICAPQIGRMLGPEATAHQTECITEYRVRTESVGAQQERRYDPAKPKGASDGEDRNQQEPECGDGSLCEEGLRQKTSEHDRHRRRQEEASAEEEVKPGRVSLLAQGVGQGFWRALSHATIREIDLLMRSSTGVRARMQCMEWNTRHLSDSQRRAVST